MTAIKARRDTLGKPAERLTQQELEPGAARLLAALAGGAIAVLRGGDTTVSIERRSADVSLGGGRADLSVAELLVRQDLACWSTMRGRRVLRVTEAGVAHLSRRAASRALGRDHAGHHPHDVKQHAFAAQHREVIENAAQDGAVQRVNAAESPLSWLFRRREQGFGLSAAAFEAGERLRRDLTIARSMPSMTARWDAGATSRAGLGPRDPAAASDSVIAARQRVRLALDAAGPNVAGLLVDVCGFLKGLAQVEGERRWPARSGKVVLAMALDRLAVHYGLSNEARGRDAPAAIRTWIAAGES